MDVLVLGPRRHGRSTAGLVTSVVLVLTISGFLAAGAVAQSVATSTAPPDTRSDQAQPDRDGHSELRGAHHRDRKGQQLTERDRARRDHSQYRQAERDREDRPRHLVLGEKLKSFDAAPNKAALERLMQRRRPPANRLAHDRDERPAGSPADIIMTRGISGHDDRPDRPRHQGLPPIPAAVRAATADAPKDPHGWQPPKPTVIGGAAPYDAKKGAVISGATMHRKL